MWTCHFHNKWWNEWKLPQRKKHLVSTVECGFDFLHIETLQNHEARWITWMAGLAWSTNSSYICEEASPPPWPSCQNKWTQQLRHLCLPSLFVTVFLSFTKRLRHLDGAEKTRQALSSVCEQTECAESGFQFTLLYLFFFFLYLV